MPNSPPAGNNDFDLERGRSDPLGVHAGESARSEPEEASTLLESNPDALQQSPLATDSPGGDIGGNVQLPNPIDRPLHRGRPHADQNQVTIAVQCPSQHDFEQSLRAFLADPNHNRAHTVYSCVFPISAAFQVDLGPEDRGPAASNSYRYGPISTPYTASAPIQAGHIVRSMSIMEALSYTPDDPKERMRRQRAVARSLKIAIEKVDGHRYAYSNGWLGRENDAFRFSYFCNDSMLNKDRSAAGSNKTKSRKRTRKPVFDCQGMIAVKFSTPKQELEVTYKHIPLHGTYDERAPPPRKNSKRYKVLELNDPNNELVRMRKEAEEAKLHPKKPREAKAKPKAGMSATKPAPKYRKQRPGLDNAQIKVLDPSHPDGATTQPAVNQANPSATLALPLPVTQGDINSAAMAGDTNEVERLKAQLAAAEQRIQRLESLQPPLGGSPVNALASPQTPQHSHQPQQSPQPNARPPGDMAPPSHSPYRAPPPPHPPQQHRVIYYDASKWTPPPNAMAVQHFPQQQHPGPHPHGPPPDQSRQQQQQQQRPPQNGKFTFHQEQIPTQQLQRRTTADKFRHFDPGASGEKRPSLEGQSKFSIEGQSKFQA